MPDVPAWVGGSFAPPLTETELKAAEKLAERGDGPVRDGVLTLVKMARTFLKTPKSKAAGSPHPSGQGRVVRLDPAEVDRIESVVPWRHELDSLAGVFEGIDPARDKPLRDAAFHLLWYGYKLTADREPATTDTL